MDDINVTVFAQAKVEYTKQLIDVLYMNMYDGIRSIYSDSKNVYRTQTKHQLIHIFRSLLEKVPKWNSEIIQRETERIIDVSKCDWLDDLLTAVFISHTRILMSIGNNQKFNKINVTIPKTTTFIHKSYINIAREIWKNPYLFNENIIGHEYQRNMRQVEEIVKSTIEDTIRRQLPMKEILKENLEPPEEKQNLSNDQLQLILEELKKTNQSRQVASSVISDNEEDEEDDNDSNDSNSDNTSQQTIYEKYKNANGINYSIEETPPIDGSSATSDLATSALATSDLATPASDTIATTEDNTIATTEDNTDDYNIYNDPNDPTKDEIERACKDIVLNDITEPVDIGTSSGIGELPTATESSPPIESSSIESPSSPLGLSPPSDLASFP